MWKGKGMADQWACLLRNNDVHRSYNHFHQIWCFLDKAEWVQIFSVFWVGLLIYPGKGRAMLELFECICKSISFLHPQATGFFCWLPNSDNKGFLPSMRCGWQNQKKKFFFVLAVSMANATTLAKFMFDCLFST